MNPRFILIFLTVLLTATGSVAQTTRRVLFLGNSYTAYNNLPQLVKDAALSAGDTLIFDSHTPGGYTLLNHVADAVSTGKIAVGSWDYVVLQGQSQEPVLQNFAFNNGGLELDELITQYNPCGVTMLYVTWGRKNGDASTCAAFPATCTYAGMDSTLRNSYMTLAALVDGELSPVSVVWNYLRQHHPGMELYQGDGSHPSALGSYVAACCFYTAIFKRDPALITYNAGLNATDASTIKNAVKMLVFDQPGAWDYKQMPQSGIQYSIGPGTNEAIFGPANHGISQTYSWDFGDGNTSTAISPSHSYASGGTYTVSLTTTTCDLEGLHTSSSDTVIQFCAHTPVITANALLCSYDTLWTQTADAYQWFSGGSAIPVTTRYLPDYGQYGGMDFAVLATAGGCSEMSQVFVANPQWSGYYFDAAMGGDPCEGDTAIFAVLHISSLTGSEIIRWYRDGSLLSFANDLDTLLITDEGTYECKVTNPASGCPVDTSSAVFVVDCGVLNMQDNNPDPEWRIYPNPASETITIEFANDMNGKNIRMFDVTGRLVKTIKMTAAAHLNVSDLPNGIYYLRSDGSRQDAVKFIKQ